MPRPSLSVGIKNVWPRRLRRCSKALRKMYSASDLISSKTSEEPRTTQRRYVFYPRSGDSLDDGPGKSEPLEQRREGNDRDEHSFPEAVASLSSAPSSIHAISEKWIEGNPLATNLEDVRDWKEAEYKDERTLSSSSLHTHFKKTSLLLVTPPKKEKSIRKLRWMSPISTVQTIVSASSSAADVSPLSNGVPSNLHSIFRKEKSVSCSNEVAEVEGVSMCTAKIFERDPVNDMRNNDGHSDDVSFEDDNDMEILRITFTPSEDSQDMSDCESPVASVPKALKVDQLEEKKIFFNPSLETYKCPSTTKIQPSPQMSMIWKLVTVVLALSCISGDAGQLLNNFAVIYNNAASLQTQRTLGFQHFQGPRSEFDFPGQFLETRHSVVGVWLK